MNYFSRLFILLALFFSTTVFSADSKLDFKLKSKKGMIEETSYPDQYLLMAIGYTGCPDVCPTTLLEVSGALKYLDQKKLSKKLVPIFITIDPNRDTLDNISKYAAYFDSRIIGSRALDEQGLDHIVKELHATYGYKIDGKPATLAQLKKETKYDVYHSTYIYLYDPTRHLVDVFTYGTSGEELGKKLEQYLK